MLPQAPDGGGCKAGGWGNTHTPDQEPGLLRLGEVGTSAPVLAAKLGHPTPHPTHPAVQSKLSGALGFWDVQFWQGGQAATASFSHYLTGRAEPRLSVGYGSGRSCPCRCVPQVQSLGSPSSWDQFRSGWVPLRPQMQTYFVLTCSGVSLLGAEASSSNNQDYVVFCNPSVCTEVDELLGSAGRVLPLHA